MHTQRHVCKGIHGAAHRLVRLLLNRRLCILARGPEGGGGRRDQNFNLFRLFDAGFPHAGYAAGIPVSWRGAQIDFLL